MKDIVERLNIVRESLEAGCDDWPIASQIWEYKTAASEIESLRQQLAEKASEIERLKATLQRRMDDIRLQAERHVSLEDKYRDMSQQLAASQAENESLRRANKECVEYFNEAQKDLAASQAREQQYRRALVIADNAGDDEWHPYTPEQAKTAIGKTIALPQDTSALEAMIQKAGEVMRERVMQARGKGQLYPMDLRALPGVTLEDLRK